MDIGSKSVSARRRFESAVSGPPPRRRWGMRYSKVYFIFGSVILLGFLGWLLLSVLIAPSGVPRNPYDWTRDLTAIAILLLIVRWGWTRVNPHHRTVRNTTRTYPGIRSILERYQEKPEVLRRALPIIDLGGAKYVLADFRDRRDRQLQQVTSSLLVVPGGKVVDDAELYSRAYITVSLAHATSFEVQAHVEQERKSLNRLGKSILPRWKRALEANQELFAELGQDRQAGVLFDSWDDILAIVRLRDNLWAYQQSCVQAIGYGFALEVREEDALRRHEAESALAELIQAGYMAQAVTISQAAADLQATFNGTGHWRQARSLKNALFFFSRYQTTLRQAAQSLGSRNEPDRDAWAAYRAGVAKARKMGIAVARDPSPPVC